MEWHTYLKLMALGHLVISTLSGSFVAGQDTSEDGSGSELLLPYDISPSSNTLLQTTSMSEPGILTPLSEALPSLSSKSNAPSITVMLVTSTTYIEKLVPATTSVIGILTQPSTSSRLQLSAMIAPTPVPPPSPATTTSQQNTSTMVPSDNDQPSVSTELILGVGVGVGCALLIMVITLMVLIVVCYGKKRNSGPRKKGKGVEKADSFVLHKMNTNAFSNSQQTQVTDVSE